MLLDGVRLIRQRQAPPYEIQDQRTRGHRSFGVRDSSLRLMPVAANAAAAIAGAVRVIGDSPAPADATSRRWSKRLYRN